uniref:Uncharacterized protein MANES_06G130800 n=1 Tax=Rhizophora mucronata TaxID=61149 RepID=A0A2P2MKF0_RHIMU
MLPPRTETVKSSIEGSFHCDGPKRFIPLRFVAATPAFGTVRE